MANVGVDSYVLRLQEQISGPLLKIQQQVEKLTERMLKLEQSTKKVSTQLTLPNIDSGINLLTKAFHGLVGIMESGIGIAQKFLGTVIEVAAFRTQNITALSTFLPGAGRGAGVFNRALDVGGITPMDELEMVKQVKELASAGFQGGGLNRANAALADVHSMLGEEARGNLQYYMRKFYGANKVEKDDLRMAAFSAGMTENDLKARMKKLGGSSGQYAIEALFQGINEKLDGGKGLGTAARQQGEGTLAGLLSNIEAAPRKFLAQMDLEKMHGIQVLMRFLQKLLVFFDHGTAQGKKLAETVEKMVNVLLGGLDGITEQDLDAWFEGALKVVDRLVGALKSAWEWMDQLLHGDAAGITEATARLLRDVGRFIGEGVYQAFFNRKQPSTTGTQELANTGRVTLPDGTEMRTGIRGVAATRISRAGLPDAGPKLKVLGSGEIPAGSWHAPLITPEQYVDAAGKFSPLPAGQYGPAAPAAPTVQIGTVNLSGGATEEHGQQVEEMLTQAARRARARVGAGR